ncbi:hypothetical protein [Pusillimonas sp.]|uniref:hypothetical protein n=1 Tax=Pusillimonas sp. TaxID=3040095 RepID=UPI0037C8E36D
MNGPLRPGRNDGASWPVPGVWRAIAGFIVWAVAFTVLYVGHALACLSVPSEMRASTVSLALGVLWAAHLLACAALAWRSGGQWRRLRHGHGEGLHGRFMWRTTFLIDVSALGAVFVTGLPLLVFPACAP